MSFRTSEKDLTHAMLNSANSTRKVTPISPFVRPLTGREEESVWAHHAPHMIGKRLYYKISSSEAM